MADKNKVNPRKKALDAISTKIAIFMMWETYAGKEEDAQKLLNEAIGNLDAAAKILVANDEKAAQSEPV